MANNAQSVLDIARSQLGYSRWDDPQAGTKYGRWYEEQIDRNPNNYNFGGSGVPYCGMFVSWVFDQAGASCPGVPGAYTPSMLAAGKAAGKAVARGIAQPGDVVYFDWGGDGVTDHVGIVEANNGSYLTTLEGNVDNGCVRRKTRNFSTVSGVIRPNYGGAQTPAPAPSTGTTTGTTASNGSIADVQRWCASAYGYSQTIDGIWGPNTRKGLIVALQTELNRQYGRGLVVDGIWGPKTYSACVNVKQGAKGNITKTLQGGLICRGYNTGGFDGDFGPATNSAVRTFQQRSGLEVDGIAGPQTFRALLS